MAKAVKVELTDLPIMNVGGVNYYAFNVALRYLKQNNKEFKGMTMKKFKEQYGEDSIFKLTGCGSWISVELFNELSNKMTKVVVKSSQQEIKGKEHASAFAGIFTVRDEATKRAHEQVIKEIPNKVHEELVKLEEADIFAKDTDTLINNIYELLDRHKEFSKHGYNTVPFMNEKGTGYLVGDGVFVQFNFDGYDYCEFNGFDDCGDWEADKFGKLCKYVDAFNGISEHMGEFVPIHMNFTGMTPYECFLECYKLGMLKDNDGWSLSIEGTDAFISREEFLELIGVEQTWQKNLVRWIDLTPFYNECVVEVEFREL